MIKSYNIENFSGSEIMKPYFHSFCCRLPGGERFNDFIKCILAYLKHPRAFPPAVFHNSLHHFFLGGDYGIIIPRDGVEFPDKLYHVTSEKNLDNILKKEYSLLAAWFFSPTAFRTLRTISNGNKFPTRIGTKYFC